MGLINYEFKRISKVDLPFMEDMIFNSIYVEEGKQIPKNIIYKPEIYKYIDGWNNEKDTGFIVVDKETNKKVGAAWLRYFSVSNKGYGFIAEDTPELSIALYSDYRGKGLGTAMLEHLFSNMPENIKSVSLSVDLRNPAKRLYERLGFKDYFIEHGTAIMKYDKQEI